jgi:hypothetical protein
MNERIVVWPDVHTPLHDEKSIKAAIEFLIWYKPHHFIQLGDFCDYNSISRFDLHYPEEAVKLEDEIKAAKCMLDRIENALPPYCRKYMIGGNHEDRWHPVRAKFKFELPGSISLVYKELKRSWGEELDLTSRGWWWCEYGKVLELGKIIYKHGKSTSKNGSAKVESDKHPGKNVIFGHTHCHNVCGRIDHKNLPIEAETIGTLSRFDLAYLKGDAPVDWVNMFMYIDVAKSGWFSKHPVHIINGRFIECLKEFSA